MDPTAPRRSAEPRLARLLTVLTAAAVLAAGAGAGGSAAHELDDRMPGAVTMDFVPPPPGTYVLNAIMPAPDGPVLDRDGRRRPLARFTAGKITLLGFIYTSCADPRGCPLTAQVFHTVRHRVSQDSDLRARVRLVSLSFDPVRDTPAVMRHYAAEVPDNGVEWAFLTTERPRTLVPLLDGFGQDVRVELDAHGRRAGPLAPVLKVFLIDTRGVVREIYTTSYLYPEVILNDIKTLRLEDRTARRTDP
jgi:cytochrome oxidase Cu insertion factor (SCO1/SenC/PrrC family)